MASLYPSIQPKGRKVSAGAAVGITCSSLEEEGGGSLGGGGADLGLVSGVLGIANGNDKTSNNQQENRVPSHTVDSII